MLTALYIDRYGFGVIFAYFSLIVLIVLWTFLFSYIGFQLTGYQTDYRPRSVNQGQETISLILVEKIDVNKVLLTIWGLAILLLTALVAQLIFGESWAIASFLLVGSFYVYWLCKNWLKK